MGGRKFCWVARARSSPVTDKQETVPQRSGKTGLVGEYIKGVSGSYRRLGAFCKTAFCKTQALRLH